MAASLLAVDAQPVVTDDGLRVRYIRSTPRRRASTGRPREVLAALAEADRIRERNPSLFSRLAQHDRDCLQLLRTAARLKTHKIASSSRPDRDELERVDPASEQRFADRRARTYTERRRSFADEERARRASLTELELHRELVARAAARSTVGAANIEASSAGSETPLGVPKQQLLDDDPRWNECKLILRSRLEQMHELLDEYSGHSTRAAASQLDSIDKDRMILSPANRGLSNQAVVDRLGGEIAGSARTVARVRRAADLDSNGYPRVATAA